MHVQVKLLPSTCIRKANDTMHNAIHMQVVNKHTCTCSLPSKFNIDPENGTSWSFLHNTLPALYEK